jgi:hypothetical protein
LAFGAHGFAQWEGRVMTAKLKPWEDAEQFRKLSPLEQIHALEDFLDEFKEAIDDAEEKQKRRHLS